MLNFTFQTPTRIVFGKDTRLQVGALIKPLANKVLIHYGGGSIKKSGLYDEITNSLQQAGVAYVALGGVEPNPRLSLVREGIALAKKEGVELILAVGGGSAIDSSKAIALGLANPEVDIWDVFVNGMQLTKSTPVACVLTLPAAGSEGSNSCVISNLDTAQKLGCNLECNRPRLSIIDPTVFYTIPKNQIANGIADMMSHIMERYFSNTAHTELIDGLCEATLKTLVTFGPKVYADPRDYDAWCQVSLSGTLAHNNVLGLGREQDWACHKMEHELSARFDIPHGAGLAVLTPEWMRYCKDANPARFFAFATRVMGVPPQGDGQADIEATIQAGIAKLEAFFAGLGLPQRLSEMGIDEDSLSDMAERAMYNGDGSPRQVGFLKRLYAEDIEKIYRAVL